VLPHYFGSRSEDVMTSMFVRDIEKGIADTGIKAGVLKCATDAPGLTPGVEQVLRCCARAHRQTGVPITTHTHAATKRGLEQQRIFKEEGVDLSRVVIGHCGDSEDIAYLEEIMANGSLIGMDRFGIDVLLPTEKRVDTVAKLCKRGYADRMVLSHDAACYLDWIPGEVPPPTMQQWNYLHISKDVLPMLRDKGVTDEQIHQMLVVNPRRYFERQGAY
jgi:phosphotriesterase-related protein